MTTKNCTDQTVKRWSAKRKAEVVLRLFRGEAIDDVSRAVSIAVHVLPLCQRSCRF